ncbi:MAG: T9SS type A sorting domain-containing protein [Candidatus Krumholzibacteria bacterium]|nr:T9SS type A sorting domain-containing protein [Candidatus Krumholzibacteria bacterium]
MHRSVFTCVVLCLAVSILAVPIVGENVEDIESELEALRQIIAEKGYSFTVGRTPLSGLSKEELAQRTGFIPPSKEEWASLPPFVPGGFSYPGAGIDDPVFDWRTLSGVTGVRDQGACGSCWAFAAIGQLEGHIAIYDGMMMDLSEQHIMDCNKDGQGCGGGNAHDAYNLLVSFGAITENCIPYTGVDGGSCGQAFCTSVAVMTGYSVVAYDVTSIKTALLSGPVYSAVRTSSFFNNYDGGCFDYNDYINYVDHAVLIVGWDDTACDGGGAWIVKNSWGESWGDGGYIYIRYGMSQIGFLASQIQYAPFTSLISPNGGQTIYSGMEYAVRWSNPGLEPDSISLAYSISGAAGPFDNPIASGLTGVEVYGWLVPEIASEHVMVKLTAWLDGNIRAIDLSDDVFEITEFSSKASSYPNPFPTPMEEKFNILYTIDSPGRVKITIFDVRGRVVKVVEELDRDTGSYEVQWDGRDADGTAANPGVYFYLLEAPGTTRSEKIVLLR